MKTSLRLTVSLVVIAVALCVGVAGGKYPTALQTWVSTPDPVYNYTLVGTLSSLRRVPDLILLSLSLLGCLYVRESRHAARDKSRRPLALLTFPSTLPIPSYSPPSALPVASSPSPILPLLVLLLKRRVTRQVSQLQLDDVLGESDGSTLADAPGFNAADLVEPPRDHRPRHGTPLPASLAWRCSQRTFSDLCLIASTDQPRRNRLGHGLRRQR